MRLVSSLKLICFISNILLYKLTVLELLLNNKYFLANMQVPSACQLLKELSRTRNTGNGSSYNNNNSSTSLSTAKKNGVDVFNLVDLAYAKPHTQLLRLKWKKLERLVHKVGGARNIFMELYGKNRGNDAFWLDTSSSDKVGSLLLKLST